MKYFYTNTNLKNINNINKNNKMSMLFSDNGVQIIQLGNNNYNRSYQQPTVVSLNSYGYSNYYRPMCVPRLPKGSLYKISRPNELNPSYKHRVQVTNPSYVNNMPYVSQMQQPIIINQTQPMKVQREKTGQFKIYSIERKTSGNNAKNNSNDVIKIDNTGVTQIQPQVVDGGNGLQIVNLNPSDNKTNDIILNTVPQNNHSNVFYVIAPDQKPPMYFFAP